MIYEKQNNIINYLVDILKEFDKNVVLYLKGSIARGEADCFSDIDFYCLVPEDKYDELLLLREELLSKYRRILYKGYVNFGLEQIIVVYDDNTHIDFYVTKDIPKEGIDNIYVLYDLYNKLDVYKRKKIKESTDNIADYINSAIFNLLEIDVAYQRNDILWLMRLLSHMLANLSLVLCYYFNSNKPVLHMKGIYKTLPMCYKNQVDDILLKMNPNKIEECISSLLKLLQMVVDNTEKEIYIKLNIGYIYFMNKRYNL